MAAIDLFRPARIHSITRLRLWPAAPGGYCLGVGLFPAPERPPASGVPINPYDIRFTLRLALRKSPELSPFAVAISTQPRTGLSLPLVLRGPLDMIDNQNPHPSPLHRCPDYPPNLTASSSRSRRK